MFGQDGPYFALGPLRFTRKTLLENLMAGVKEPVKPIMDRVVDYESHYAFEEDTFVLFLDDGTSETRKFKRLYKTTDDGKAVGQQSKASENFAAKLKEKCGY